MKYALTNPDLCKPCPKCGQKDRIVMEEVFDFKWRIGCSRCEDYTRWELQPEQAVEEWNRRANAGIGISERA